MVERPIASPASSCLAIPNKPFFADTRTDWTRVLEDGSTVKVYLEARLARDSQGRVYR